MISVEMVEELPNATDGSNEYTLHNSQLGNVRPSMSKTELLQADIALLYLDTIPAEFFDGFRKLADEKKLDLLEEPRENVPYAALEWVIPTAVAVYVGMKFIDAFFKRAADDVADSVYPRFKSALHKIAKRVLIDERSRFNLFSSSPKKVVNPHSLLFSVLSETRCNRGLKFIFDRVLSDAECEECINQVFVLLQQHYENEDNTDALSVGIDATVDARSRVVYVLFNSSTDCWEVIDPMREARNRQDRLAEDTECDVT